MNTRPNTYAIELVANYSPTFLALGRNHAVIWGAFPKDCCIADIKTKSGVWLHEVRLLRGRQRLWKRMGRRIEMVYLEPAHRRHCPGGTTRPDMNEPGLRCVRLRTLWEIHLV